ncbi:tetratricopeptide repeat protein [Olsenella profusa]|uniref:Tetratricopeptide repeat protein n=1 Tax=Olsenella profusa TaxID=138595 RepID=A0ABS2F2Z0_9ACTN|nr:tetratricopeptide repeat protein [Olsenella profusa]MBM6775364.1 tetratricopeptide repeat protein [Olsenella profusa]
MADVDDARGADAAPRDDAGAPEAPDADAGARGRLGRLFAALVSNEAEAAGRAAALPEGTGSASQGSVPEDSGSAEAAAAHDRATSRLDIEALSRRLMGSANPEDELRSFVADVRQRSDSDTATDRPAPSDFELYLATRLTEAGIRPGRGGGCALPSVSVVRPHTSGLFYLRVLDDSMPWGRKVALLRVEAALNCALLAEHALPDANAASLDEIVRCEQRVCRSIVSQASRAAARLEAPAYGEWAVRNALSAGIERLRLPFRLTARFRVNVAAGAAAMEIDLVPPSAWPASVYVDGLGVVSATTEMRRRAASDYNLRLGILLASYAFRAAPQLSEVWVAGVLDTAHDHTCYYSARLTRGLVEELDADGALDPFVVMRAAGATMDAGNRELAPIRQGFSLEDELFCPARRYDPPELSERRLLPSEARALGCKLVRDLGIDEAAARKHLATSLSRRLTSSTEKNVREILSALDEYDAPDVRAAALRCVQELIDGTLEDDPLALEESLVEGDALSRAAAQARELLAHGSLEDARRMAEGALEQAAQGEAADAAVPEEAPTLAPAAGGDDAPKTAEVRRCFGSYGERALYNRLLARPGERCRLVRPAYLEAHLIASAAALAAERMDDAVTHARSAVELAPMSSQTSLHLAQCLEAAGSPDAAFDELCRMLSLAHDPESIGLGYLRMSQFQWRDGHVIAAQACYQRACRYLPTPALVAGLAVVALIAHVGDATDGSLTDEQVERTLAGAGIPLAPTREVGEVLLEATRAAMDAEVFPVARDLMRSLCSLFRDDVSLGVLHSIEGEPDR